MLSIRLPVGSPIKGFMGGFHGKVGQPVEERRCLCLWTLRLVFVGVSGSICN